MFGSLYSRAARVFFLSKSSSRDYLLNMCTCIFYNIYNLEFLIYIHPLYIHVYILYTSQLGPEVLY